jgi:hypothetical protein
MKYALLTDNSVGWFSYLALIQDSGECFQYFDLPSGLNNEYLSNLFNREPSFFNLKVIMRGAPIDTFGGVFISEYELNRIKKMIELYPGVLEYNRLGRLEKI